MELSTMPAPIEEVCRLFQARGDSQYGGEAVTQLEHSLQAATFAEQEGADPSLISAALLHDVGHLLHDLPEDAPDHEIDDRHEALAAQWLAQHFGPDVCGPVGMHVSAKRYLCTADPAYLSQLSAPSLLSLRLQGGPMSAAEAKEFESSAHFKAAVRLRRWDEAAKVVGLATPDLQHFTGYLQQALRKPAS